MSIFPAILGLILFCPGTLWPGDTLCAESVFQINALAPNPAFHNPPRQPQTRKRTTTGPAIVRKALNTLLRQRPFAEISVPALARTSGRDAVAVRYALKVDEKLRTAFRWVERDSYFAETLTVFERLTAWWPAEDISQALLISQTGHTKKSVQRDLTHLEDVIKRYLESLPGNKPPSEASVQKALGFPTGLVRFALSRSEALAWLWVHQKGPVESFVFREGWTPRAPGGGLRTFLSNREENIVRELAEGRSTALEEALETAAERRIFQGSEEDRRALLHWLLMRFPVPATPKSPEARPYGAVNAYLIRMSGAS